MELTRCPLCARRDIAVRVGSVRDRRGKQWVTVPDVRRWYCRHCREEFFDLDAMARIEEYRPNRSRRRA